MVGSINFPASLDTPETLIEASDNASTTLGVSVNNSATTITVASTTLFPSTGIFSIDNELIAYSGKTSTTFTGCVRGFDQTIAASHSGGATVEQEVSSVYHRTIVQAILAIESRLGVGSTANRLLVTNAQGNFTPSALIYDPTAITLSALQKLQFDTSNTQTTVAATLQWNATYGTLAVGLGGSNINLLLGQQDYVRVINKSGQNLTASNYSVVRISEAQGQRLAIALAQANSEASSTDIVGIVAENISNNAEGFVLTRGLIEGINTTGGAENWQDGDTLYLSPTTAGQLTKTKPTAPNHLIIIGYVVYAHASNGKLFVSIQTSWELDELHNVLITSPTNNQVLSYDASNQRWRNATSITAASGSNNQYQLNNNGALGVGSLSELTEQVLSTKPLRVPSSGGANAAQLQLGVANNGFYASGALVAVVSSGAPTMAWNGATGSTVINGSYQLTWGSSGFSAEDLGMLRAAPGVLRISNAGASAGQLLIASSSTTISAQLQVVSALVSRPALRVDSMASPTSPIFEVRVGGVDNTGVQVDGSTTAGDTRFLLYDVTSNSLQRVVVGANDSGGTGFRLLRIANS